MRTPYRILFSLLIVLSTSAAAYATWCSDPANYEYPSGLPAIFCDDFDRYCDNPPAAPAPCPAGSPVNPGAIQSVWVMSSTDPGGKCSKIGVWSDTPMLTSPPYGAKTVNGGDEGGHISQSTVDLVDEIHSAIGPEYDLAMGTDAQPLYLRFEMSGGIQDNVHIPYDNGYIELAKGNDHAPLDYVMVGWAESDTCTSCFGYCVHLGVENSGVHVPWPTVCQSYDARTTAPHCPPLQTNVRSALSIGAVAMLDNNPCHCENPADQVPANWHLSFYDGLKWRALKSNMFPGNGGDFTLGPKYNTVYLTIKTSTVDVYHRTRNAEQTAWVESTATGIPRIYIGGFNKMRAGAADGCELSNGSYNCTGNVHCIRMGEFRCDGGGWQDNKSSWVVFDGVALYGGQGSSTVGACCKSDATCVEGSPASCTTLGGQFQGSGSTCANTACCPYPFADADHDGDVDQIDFGFFQVCYNGTGAVPTGCECFNRDDDTDVDTADFTAFSNCFTGANIPWAQSITPSCTP